jgi:hypothetical protein
LHRAGQQSDEERDLPVTVARAIIMTMVLLASKFNFDEGLRMKHVRADADACSALGPGVVKLFRRVEEHVLVLFDWQLRVTASEYAAHYDKLVELQAQRAETDGSYSSIRKSLRVQSVPTSLFALGAPAMDLS